MKNGSEIDTSANAGIRWTVHPVKKNWKISVLIIIFLIVLCISINFSFDSLSLSLLSVIFLFGSLSSFFLPTTYTLYDKGIAIKTAFRELYKEWDFFKRYYIDKNGILLSPFPYRTRLENFRGLYIRFDNNKEQVINFIKSRIIPIAN